MTTSHNRDRRHTRELTAGVELIARLRRERLNEQRRRIGLAPIEPLVVRARREALRTAESAPRDRTVYTPGAYRHLVAIACVLVFALAFIGTWSLLDQHRRPPGYARYIEPTPTPTGGTATQAQS